MHLQTERVPHIGGFLILEWILGCSSLRRLIRPVEAHEMRLLGMARSPIHSHRHFQQNAYYGFCISTFHLYHINSEQAGSWNIL